MAARKKVAKKVPAKKVRRKTEDLMAERVAELVKRELSKRLGGEVKVGFRGENEIPKEFQRSAPFTVDFQKPADVLAKAKDIIYGDREQTYGEPGFNLQSIGDLWTVYLRRKMPDQVISPLETHDVCQLMILLKTARLINNPGHLDSLVDQCGYAALQERVLPF